MSADKAAESGASAVQESLFDLARDHLDGADCGAPMMAALSAEVASRRRRANILKAPASPDPGPLQVRRAGLSDWWEAGRNLLLTAPGDPLPDLRANIVFGVPTDAVIVIGDNASACFIDLCGAESFIVLGRHVNLQNVSIAGVGRCTILIGDWTSATMRAHIDARNDGAVLVGRDGMWADDVILRTDDGHAIRDAETGERLNARGGRIVIGEHVWLSEQVRVLGGAEIGPNSVVGAGALVKNISLPANTVSVGQPARPVRSGVTWTREDLP